MELVPDKKCGNYQGHSGEHAAYNANRCKAVDERLYCAKRKADGPSEPKDGPDP